jgi:hypothetical protein
MPKNRPSDKFSKDETRQRFEAAIRGARAAGSKPFNDIPKKNGESRVAARQRKSKKTRKS